METEKNTEKITHIEQIRFMRFFCSVSAQWLRLPRGCNANRVVLPDIVSLRVYE